MQYNLESFFERYLKKESFFINKKALQSNFTPDEIPHRENQIKQIADILAPALKLERPSNIFIYGKTGTGKTVSVRFITNKLKEIAEKREIPLKVFYLNCKLKKVADTEYRLLAHLIREFGRKIPPTGLPTDEVYKILFEIVDSSRQIIVLILDEIDQLVKKTGDEILYNLTRINTELKKTQIAIIGISNDLVFIDNLDPRVKSSLSEEEIIFPPYNALQIQDILRQRAAIAFKENVLCKGVIEKCAAYAAREHGDARRALELLRVAGELAEREGESKVKIKHIDLAEGKIERDRIIEIVTTQPTQHKITLKSIFNLSVKKNSLYTGEIYEEYKELCKKNGLSALTQRRLSDIIAELDMLGIINAKVISKGRYGRTREISIAIPKSLISKIRLLLDKELE